MIGPGAHRGGRAKSVLLWIAVVERSADTALVFWYMRVAEQTHGRWLFESAVATPFF
jgi:hypothetical protein